MLLLVLRPGERVQAVEDGVDVTGVGIQGEELVEGESAGDLVVPALVFLAALLAAAGVVGAMRRGDRTGGRRPGDDRPPRIPGTAITQVPAPRSPLAAAARQSSTRHTARHAVRS